MNETKCEPLLIGFRLDKNWSAAYNLLDSMKANASADLLGWVYFQTALTKFVHQPAFVRTSLELTDRALPLLESDRVNLAKALINGTVFAEYALDLSRHTSYVDQLLALLDDVAPELKPWQGRILMRIGLFNQRVVGKYRVAAGYFHRAARFYARNVGPYGPDDRLCSWGTAHMERGESLLVMGFLTDARKEYSRALKVADAKRSPELTSFCLGRVSELDGRLVEAGRLYQESVTAAMVKDDHNMLTQAARALVSAYHRTGQQEPATAIVQNLIGHFVAAEVPEMVCKLQRLLQTG